MIHPSRWTRFLLPMIALALVAAAAPGDLASAEASASATFERMKVLVGTWQGVNQDGETMEASYQLTGNGTALIESLRFIGKPDHDMTTVYHLDGDRLMLTHYCVVGNQPRMVAAAGGGKLIRFDFHDITNRQGDGGFMHHATLEIEDDDHMRQAWTFRQGGEDQHTVAVQYRRLR